MPNLDIWMRSHFIFRWCIWCRNTQQWSCTLLRASQHEGMWDTGLAHSWLTFTIWLLGEGVVWQVSIMSGYYSLFFVIHKWFAGRCFKTTYTAYSSSNIHLPGLVPTDDNCLHQLLLGWLHNADIPISFLFWLSLGKIYF